MVKLRTDKEKVVGWSNSKKTNFDLDFSNKNIKARGVFVGNYTKKFLNKFLDSGVENASRIEVSLCKSSDGDASLLVFKNLDNNKTFVMAGLRTKHNYNLKGKIGINNKKY